MTSAGLASGIILKEKPGIAESNQARSWVGRVTPVAPFFVIALRRRAEDCPAYLLLFPFRGKAPQWRFVFTLMTLELGLVPLPLYARNR